MIQRIQSVYLLAVVILLVLALCMPIGFYPVAGSVEELVLNPLGITLADGTFQSTWGLFAILLLSAIVALATIFLYKNRMLQVRMTVFNSVLLVGYYVVCSIFIFVIKDDLAAESFRFGWALCLPLVTIILNYLAFRSIMSDELMVKAADHLRPRR